jgi:hypothetical protein
MHLVAVVIGSTVAKRRRYRHPEQKADNPMTKLILLGSAVIAALAGVQQSTKAPEQEYKVQIKWTETTSPWYRTRGMPEHLGNGVLQFVTTEGEAVTLRSDVWTIQPWPKSADASHSTP